MKTIKIEGTEYRIDIDRAKEFGVLKEKTKYPLLPGDVYVCEKGNVNNLLLIQTQYGLTDKDKRYNLLGIGFSPNSNDFYCKPDHTIEEIKKHLEDKKMQFSHNIGKEIRKLVNKIV